MREGGRDVRIGFLMRRYKPTDFSHTPEVVAILAAWGATVQPIYLYEHAVDLAEVRVEHDLYVLKDKSQLAMSVAACLHAAGAAIVNPYPASATLRNKVVTFHVLRAAGVPTPQTFVASRFEQLRGALKGGPLIVKPHQGSRGEGIQIVQDIERTAVPLHIGEPVFAQRYHPPAGPDWKLYSIGRELFGVKRVWPPRTYTDKLGESFTPSPELAVVARGCGHAFGIDLFGVDIVESDGQLYVVDMSSLPGFKGVPNAARRLAEYIYNAAVRALAGEPPVPDFPPKTALPRDAPLG
jgi:ribosomal protein S6--L-glutamate ligase